jgi:hypothetical protein
VSKPKSARKQPLTDAQKATLGKGPITKFQRQIRKAIEAGRGGRK